MASRRGRREPVNPGTKSSLPIALQEKSGEVKDAESVSSRSKAKKGSGLTPSSASGKAITPSAKGSKSNSTQAPGKTPMMETTDSPVRRSSRQRKSISALELLGIKIKTEPVDEFADESESQTARRPGRPKSKPAGPTTLDTRGKTKILASQEQKTRSAVRAEASTPQRRSQRGQPVEDEKAVKSSADQTPTTLPRTTRSKSTPSTKEQAIKETGRTPSAATSAKSTPSQATRSRKLESSAEDQDQLAAAAKSTPSRATRSRKSETSAEDQEQSAVDSADTSAKSTPSRATRSRKLETSVEDQEQLAAAAKSTPSRATRTRKSETSAEDQEQVTADTSTARTPRLTKSMPSPAVSSSTAKQSRGRNPRGPSTPQADVPPKAEKALRQVRRVSIMLQSPQESAAASVIDREVTQQVLPSGKTVMMPVSVLGSTQTAKKDVRAPILTLSIKRPHETATDSEEKRLNKAPRLDEMTVIKTESETLETTDEETDTREMNAIIKEENSDAEDGLEDGVMTLDPSSGYLVDSQGNVMMADIAEETEAAAEAEAEAEAEDSMEEQDRQKLVGMSRKQGQTRSDSTNNQHDEETVMQWVVNSENDITVAQSKPEEVTLPEPVEEPKDKKKIVLVDMNGLGAGGIELVEEVLLDEAHQIGELVAEASAAKKDVKIVSDEQDKVKESRPITNRDLDNAELSKTGRRAKPQTQIVMTPYLQQLMNELKPNKDLALENHVIVEKNPVTKKRIKMTCKYCDRILLDNHEFRRHIKVHKEVNSRPWKCPLCNYSSMIKAGVARHINVHSEIKPYSCCECGRSFTFKQKLQLHMRYHADIRDYLCPMCSFSFHELKTLKNHVLKIHKLQYNDIRGKVAIRKTEIDKTLASTGRPPLPATGDRPQLLKWVHDEESGLELLMQTGSLAEIVATHDEVINITPEDNNAEEEKEGPTESVSVVQQEEEVVVEAEEEEDGTEAAVRSIMHGEVGAEEVVVKEEEEVIQEDGEEKVEEEEAVIMKDDGNEEQKLVTGTDDSPIGTMSMVTLKQGNKEVLQVSVVPEEEQSKITVNMVSKEGDDNPVLTLSMVTEDEQPKGTVIVQFGEDGKLYEVEAPILKKQPVTYRSDGRMRKPPKLAGPCKTRIQTKRFKEGLPATPEKRKPVYDPVTGRRKRFVNNQRCLTEQHVEASLLEFCKLEKTLTPHKISFVCKLCTDQVFPSKTQFTGHLESRHPEVRAWSCPKCLYTCRLRSSLVAHMKVHNGNRNHICVQCGKSFLFKQKLREHMKYHLNLREYKCSDCEKAFNSKQELTRHMNRMHDYVGERAWICAICSQGFKSAYKLQRHMDSHIGFKKFLCQYCQKHYRSKTSLVQHMKSHTCMFHCEICDRNFGSYSGFMAHKVMHDESYEGYKCDMCEKVMHTKGSLKRHREVAHSTDRPFDCEECSKNFKTKKDLKNHMVVHSSTIGFTCEVCQFTCKRYESLRVHMRRHADIKPFQCGVCGKEYTQKHALEVHLRHHTGAPQSNCDICGHAFLTRFQYDMHMKTHLEADADSSGAPSGGQEVTTDGMTVFMCEECNSVFLSQDSLAVHILASHMKQGWTAGEAADGTKSPGEVPESSLEVTTESEVTDGVYGENHMVVDVPQMMSYDQRIKPEMQEAIETLVTISDPSSHQRTVTLIHPSPSKNGNFTTTQQSMEVENEEIVEQESAFVPTTSSLVHGVDQVIDPAMPPQEETFVTFTDPSTNQEYMLAVESDAIADLLSTTVAIEDGEQQGQQYVAVAETVEIAEGGAPQRMKEGDPLVTRVVTQKVEPHVSDVEMGQGDVQESEETQVNVEVQLTGDLNMAETQTQMTQDEAHVTKIEAGVTQDEVTQIEAEVTQNEVTQIEAEATKDEVTQIEAEVTQDEVAQIEAQVTQDEVHVTQDEAQVTQDEVHVTQAEVTQDEAQVTQDEAQVTQIEAEVTQNEVTQIEAQVTPHEVHVTQDEINVTQDETHVTQDEVQVTQIEAQVTQNEAQVTQDEHVTQDEVHVTQIEAQVTQDETHVTQIDAQEAQDEVRD